MKFFLFFLGVALVITRPMAAAAAATEPTTSERGNAAGPVAHFEEPSVDLGKVNPSAPVRHDFIVTNSGTEPLAISSVHPSCGCTTAGDWDHEIAPGKSGRITVEFNPANFTGPVVKTVTVSSNDRAQPTRVLEFRANVTRPLQLQPTFANFLPVEGEKKIETKVLRLVNTAEEPVKFEPPVSSDPHFKAEVTTIQPGQEFELHVSYEPTDAFSSPNGSITVRTSNAEQPVLTVPTFAMMQPAVVVIPAVLQLPAAPLTQDYVHNIAIRSNGSGPLRVTEPTSSLPGITVALTEAQPGKLFYLRVTVPKDFAAPASGEKPEIRVNTSHPKYPEIHVQILGAAAVTTEPGRWHATAQK